MENLKSQPGGKSRKLTDDRDLRRYIDELRALGGGRINCGSGLSIRVYPTSAAYCLSWMPPRRPGEKRDPQRTAVLGEAGKMSLTKARAAAEDLREKIASGFDPIAEKRERRAGLTGDALARRAREDADAKALAAIIAGGSGEYSLLAKAANRDAVSVFMRVAVTKAGDKARSNLHHDLDHFLDHAGVSDLRPADITTSMVENFLGICGVGKKVNAYNGIKRWLEWLRLHGALDANVAEKIARPARPAPRDGMYSSSDIRALWHCADLPAGKLAFLRFLLLTPLRRQEAADIKIENISTGASGYLEILIRETKNGEPMRIPLTGEAAQIVIDQKGDRKIGKLFNVGCFKKLTKKIRDKSGVAGFRWHDDRRTFTSIAVELELASFDVIDAMLNHLSAEAKSGVRAAYNKSAGIPARARLLSRWENVVRHAAETGQWPAQTTGDNVIQIGRRA